MYLLCELYTELSHTGYITCTCYVRLHRVIKHWLYYMYLLCEITTSYHTLAILHVLLCEITPSYHTLAILHVLVM